MQTPQLAPAHTIGVLGYHGPGTSKMNGEETKTGLDYIIALAGQLSMQLGYVYDSSPLSARYSAVPLSDESLQTALYPAMISFREDMICCSSAGDTRA
jgi:hypothetical protein